MRHAKLTALFVSTVLFGALSLGAGHARPTREAVPAEAHAWLEIDHEAFAANIRTLQAALGSATKLCAVMKADAYGHGMALLMPTVVALQVPCVAIASNDEARIAREQGFTGELMRIRTPTRAEVAEALPYDVEELLGNLELATAVSALGKARGRPVPFHLALNAGGMSRNALELQTEHGKRDAVAITKLDGLRLVGLMTHYAVEDRTEMLQRLAVFKDQTAWLVENAHLDRKKLVLHTANSFATLMVPEARLDLVRVGGALYGDTEPSHTEYKRVLRFVSKVAAVNAFPAGNQVGYDHTYTLQRDSRLANVPVGYADGYRRVFSNKAYVAIRGKRFPVVGRVSMNTIMVDVTDAPEVRQDDEVVLFGRQGDAEITQAELEAASDSILADLYTVWGNSNPKVLK